MATPIEGLFDELTKVRAQNLPTRQEVAEAQLGHVWLGKKGDGTLWSIKKKAVDAFELSI